MKHNHEDYHRPENRKPLWKKPFGIICIFLLAVAAYFLMKQQGANIGNNWIWLILLACPLMHVFMHGSHGGHGKHDDNQNQNNEKED